MKIDNFLKRKILIFALTLILAFLIEASLYWIVFGTFYASQFFLEFAVYLLLLSPCVLFRSNKYTIVYTSVFIGLLLILFLVNVTLHFCSRDIFSLEYFKLVSEAATIFDTDYINPVAITLLVVYASLYVGGVLLIYKMAKVTEKTKMRYLPKGLILTGSLLGTGALILCFSVLGVKHQNKDSELYADMSGYEIMEYNSTYLKKSSMKTYGVLANYLSELSAIITTGKDEETDDEYLDDEKPCTPVTDDFYGLLEGYNVIEIMVETGADCLINETLTPNLYNLSYNGIRFTNNYSKNKTNVSEFIGVAGSTVTCVANLDVVNPYSMPLMLKEKGYTSNYFHNNYGNFYNRATVMGNLGFDNLYFSEDINPDRQWYNNYDGNYPLDTDTLNDMITRLAPADSDTPYFSYWTTLSTHGPYIGEEHIEKFHELGYYDRLEAAEAAGLWSNICADDEQEVQDQLVLLQCAMMNLDEAVGNLITYLKSTNQYDNTLLILYGDHDPYYKIGIDHPLKEYMFNCEDEKNPSQYRTLMAFYNEKLTEAYKSYYGIGTNEIAEYTDFTSPYIIVPTVLELLGVDYEPNHYVGTSIFQTTSELDNMFYSNELGSVFTDKLYSIDTDDNFEYEAEGVDDAYKELFLSKITDLLERISIFNDAYNTDGFINSEETTEEITDEITEETA